MNASARILAALLKGVRCRITDFRFDGGDFMADEQTVFVTSRVALANIQHTVQTRQELIDRLQTLLKKRVVLLDNAPDHHAAMFMMCVGNRTVLVSDPAWGKRLVEQMEAERQGGSAAARGVLASARLNAVVPTTQPSKPRPSGPGFRGGVRAWVRVRGLDAFRARRTRFSEHVTRHRFHLRGRGRGNSPLSTRRSRLEPGHASSV